MGNPGLFRGSRFTFLVSEKSDYKAGVEGGYAVDALSKIQSRYFRRYPVELPLDEEPLEEFTEAVDDETADVGQAPPDPDKLTTEEYKAEVQRLKEHADLITVRKAQIKRWLIYHYMKDFQDPNLKEPGATNAYRVLLHRLTGVGLVKGRHRTPIEVWRKVAGNWEAIAAAAKDRGANKKTGVTIRGQVAKEMFEALSEETRDEYGALAEQENKEMDDGWAQNTKGPMSTTPADRQRCIKCIPKLVGPLLDLIFEATGWKGFFMGGGPEPAAGGRMKVMSVPSGTTKGDVPMDFCAAEQVRYKHIIFPIFSDFLRKCYSVEDCQARALKPEEGFALLESSMAELEALGVLVYEVSPRSSASPPPDVPAATTASNIPKATTPISNVPKTTTSTSTSSVPKTTASTSKVLKTKASTSKGSKTAASTSKRPKTTTSTTDVPKTTTTATTTTIELHPTTRVPPTASEIRSPPRASETPRSSDAPKAQAPAQMEGVASSSNQPSSALEGAASTSRDGNTSRQQTPPPSYPPSIMESPPPTPPPHPLFSIPLSPLLQQSPPASPSRISEQAGLLQKRKEVAPDENDEGLIDDTGVRPTKKPRVGKGARAPTLPKAKIPPLSNQPRRTRASGANQTPSTTSQPTSTLGTAAAAAIPLASTSANSSATAKPAWFTSAVSMMRSKELGAQWIQLVKAWEAFKVKLDFKESKKLSTTSCPEAVKAWIQRARAPAWMPAIVDTTAYEADFKLWWASVQPKWRKSSAGKVVFARVDGDWEEIRRPGLNGLLSIMAGLYFWGTALGKGDDGQKGWKQAVADCQVALNALS